MNLLAKAKCTKCGATAQGDTFEQARNQLNHSIGLGRGIKCGDNYNCVVEIVPPQQSDNVPTIVASTPKTEINSTPDISPVEDPKEKVSEEPKTESPKRKSSKKE